VKNKLYEQRLVRYILAGGLSYAIELSVLLVLYKLFGLSAELSTAIAFWIGLTASFILQKIFAFRDYEKTVKAVSKQVGVYAALVGFNYLFTLAVVAAFPAKWVVFSRTLALIITTVWNYYIYKKIIFHPTAMDKFKKKAAVYWKNHKKHLLYGVLLSLPILVFFYQYLATGNKTQEGDFDYYAQLYEAFRISVLKFHQFPFWDAWLSGGVPLYSNPQFGLFSIQSLLTLIFGSVYGLKLAYIVYGIIGFWGMYVVGRKLLNASVLRSVLIGYIWVFCGFFAGHGVWHITFTSFYFMPWLFYFLASREKKYSWLGFGVAMSLVILSSIHYAFLMLSLVLSIYFVVSLIKLALNKERFAFALWFTRRDLGFTVKTVLTIIVLAGYQFVMTYHFVSQNQRLTDSMTEPPNSLMLFIKAIFFPIGTLIKSYPQTTWGWGEYSMYIGMFTGVALLVCLGGLIYGLFSRSKGAYIANRRFIIGIIVVGLVGAAFALGDFGKSSPFYLLHSLPGFTQTRTPTRWLIMSTFAILIFLLAWQRNKKLINVLLLVSVIELFLTNGPPRITGNADFYMPPARFSPTFSQYDNGLHHDRNQEIPMNSYYFSTKSNVGQIYADDSLINTLSFTPPLETSRCGKNVDPKCDFVLTHNAKVTYWSPNRIKLERTAPGEIDLNMNVEAGWRVNGVYPFANIEGLKPSYTFALTDGSKNYTLEYAPKYSPAWINWRLKQL
jgi:putative flippase GtrA